MARVYALVYPRVQRVVLMVNLSLVLKLTRAFRGVLIKKYNLMVLKLNKKFVY